MRIKYKDWYGRIVIEDFTYARLESATTIRAGDMIFTLLGATHVFELLLTHGYADFTNYTWDVAEI